MNSDDLCVAGKKNTTAATNDNQPHKWGASKRKTNEMTVKLSTMHGKLSQQKQCIYETYKQCSFFCWHLLKSHPTTTVILLLLYSCVSWHRQLRTAELCWNSFTARMLLSTATSATGLGRRCRSSAQWHYLHHHCTLHHSQHGMEHTTVSLLSVQVLCLELTEKSTEVVTG